MRNPYWLTDSPELDGHTLVCQGGAKFTLKFTRAGWDNKVLKLKDEWADANPDPTIKLGDPLLVHWGTASRNIGFLCSADDSGLCLMDGNFSNSPHRWIWRNTITKIVRL